MTTLLTSITINPKEPVIRTVIWLHGLGADGNDFVPILPQLNLPANLGIRFIFPHAPVRPITVCGGSSLRAWYDIIAIDIQSEEDRQGIETSIAQVHALIEHERQQGIMAAQIMIAGFSQGGAIALHAGLQYPHSLGGIMGISTYLPLADSFHENIHAANRDTPIFLAHGSSDDVVPLRLGERARNELEKQQLNVDWQLYHGLAHSVSLQEVRDIGQWILQHSDTAR